PSVATKIVKKYNLTPEMSTSDFSRYTSELLKDLTDNRKRNQAFGMGLNSVMNRYSYSKRARALTCQKPSELAQRFLRDKLSEKDVKSESQKLAVSALNENAGSSRLSRLRRELRNLNASYNIVEANKFSEITRSQRNSKKSQKSAEDFKKTITQIILP
ncbi:9887_t:CDS:2, partial [Paraglomus occultum]